VKRSVVPFFLKAAFNNKMFTFESFWRIFASDLQIFSENGVKL